MTFPDQSHINRVRDALHQRAGNGASVMIGSGFSKNAEKISLDAIEMPGWQDLVDYFHSTLYPQDSSRRSGNNQRPATDNVRIAQEYEAAFGRGALHDALRRLVPDAEYSPGGKHRRLMQLPWRDIYTTNWDTLLERAQGQVPERNYSAVISVGEIPMASRPRIVKLHGSFPAQFPLIVTEEDYRTYPTKFAPFVNTVQQSMMEIGISPNWLLWRRPKFPELVGVGQGQPGGISSQNLPGGMVRALTTPAAYVGKQQCSSDRPSATSKIRSMARHTMPSIRDRVAAANARAWPSL